MTDHADSTRHTADTGGSRQPGEDQLTDDAYRDGHGEVQPDPDADGAGGEPDSGVLERQRRQVDDVESADDQADNEVLGTVED